VRLQTDRRAECDFLRKGAATEHMKKDRKSGLFDCSEVCCDVVETRRIELLSENVSDSGAPGAVCDYTFPLPKVHKQPLGVSSFISHGSCKA